MKKSNPNQKTLFQSWATWGEQPSTSKSVTKGINNTNFRCDQSSNENRQVFLCEEGLTELEDEEEESILVAAALEMDANEQQRKKDTNKENVSFTKVKHVDTRLLNKTTDVSQEVELLPGFDLEAGNVWIYPTNYPIRDYQFSIVQEALQRNTLVTLPTGLGKTFIAAVLMYNFYRWYPQGKVVFMAPTKPLVAQQIEACYKIMGIPQADTAEMTGNLAPTKREALWKSKRVFFLTPQVMQNDLGRGSCVAEEVVLLVIDEAHKALGNHAYCQVVREVSGYTRNFRVLALSATPGDDLKAVQQVISNLLISHVELRSEDSPDIQPYTHDRKVEKYVIPLGEDIARVKNAYLKVLENVVGRLFCNRALWQKDPQRVSKFMLLSAREQFQKRMEGQPGARGQNGAILGDFAMCISLYHAYELLLQHGILSFYNFIKGIMDGTKGIARAKVEIMKHQNFVDQMNSLREQIDGSFEDEQAQRGSLFSQVVSPRRRNMHRINPTFKSHPKLLKLEEIVVEHFEKFPSHSKGSLANTRVMIFSQYRDSVNEITSILSKHSPLVKVMSFIGQQTSGKSTRGLKQKEQLEVLQRFRKGGYNTLVSTCVGEEGLDIGDVDLIVCFDAHASPIRLIQRMGRTGRKRDGRIVILVTEGKEEQIYKRSQSSKKSIHKAVNQSAKSFDLYENSPRMIPRHLAPTVHKMEMTVDKFVDLRGKKKRKSEGSNIEKLLSTSETSKKCNGLLSYEELEYWHTHFKLPDHEAGLTPQMPLKRTSRRSLADVHREKKQLSLTEWIQWQSVPSAIGTVTHSRKTHHLVELLQFIEIHSGENDGNLFDYDAEMSAFLNKEDISTPEDGKEDGIEEHPLKKGENAEGKSNKKFRTKRKRIAFESDDSDSEYQRNIMEKSKTAGCSNVGESHPEKILHEQSKSGNNEKSKSKHNSKCKKRRSSESRSSFEVNFHQLFEDGESDEDFDIALHSKSVFDEPVPQSIVNTTPSLPKSKSQSIQNGDESVQPRENLLDAPVANDPFFSIQDQKAETLDKTSGVNLKTTLKLNLEQSFGTPTENRDGDSNKGEGSKDSDDDLAVLLPMVHPQNFSSRGALKDYFPAAANCVVPTPPSLDSLANISSENLEHEVSLDRENSKITEREKNNKFVMETQKVIDNFDLNDCFWDSFEDDIRNDTACQKGKYYELLEKELSKGIEENAAATNKEYNRSTCDEQKNKEKKQLTDRDSIDQDDCSSAFGAGVVCGIGKAETCEEDFDMGDPFSVFTMNDEEPFENNHCQSTLNKSSDSHCESQEIDSSAPMPSLRTRLNAKIPRVDHPPSSSEQREDTSKSVESKKALANSDSHCESQEIDSSAPMPSLRTRLNAKIPRVDHPPSSFEQWEDTSKSVESKKALAKHTSLPTSNIAKSISNINDFKLHLKDQSTKTFSRNSNCTADQNSCKDRVQTTGTLLSCKLKPTSSLQLRGIKSNGERTNMILTEESNMHATRNLDSGSASSSNHTVKSSYCNIKPIGTASITIDKSVSHCKDFHRKPDRLRLSNKTTSNSNIENRSSISFIKQTDSATKKEMADSEKDILDNCNESNDDEIWYDEGRFKNDFKKIPISIQRNQNSAEKSTFCKTSAKLKVMDGSVVAVMESDEESEQEQETPIKPARRKNKRKNALSSPCSQELKDSEEKMLDHSRLNPKRIQVGSTSEDEFETGAEVKKAEKTKRRNKNVEKLLSKQSKLRRHEQRRQVKKKKEHDMNGFVDNEAELSENDVGQVSTDEMEDEDIEEDSFIDDSTQLTQATPLVKHRQKVDMQAIYRQSLFSPFREALNFHTPAFHKQGNRYKMVFNNRKRKSREESESPSEAEETFAWESDLENEVFEAEERERRTPCEESYSEIDVQEMFQSPASEEESFDASQVRKPSKFLKRKRILDDSVTEEELSSKETEKTFSGKITPKYHSCGQNQVDQCGTKNSTAFKNFSLRTAKGNSLARDFVKSSVVLEDNGYSGLSSNSSLPAGQSREKEGFVKPIVSEKLQSRCDKNSDSSSMASPDWCDDVSDAEFLRAVELTEIDNQGTHQNNKKIAVDIAKEELDEIAFAMEMTDEDVFSEINDLPNFTLDFEFLGNVNKNAANSVDQQPTLGKGKLARIEPSVSSKICNTRTTDSCFREPYNSKPLNFKKPVVLDKRSENSQKAVSPRCQAAQSEKKQFTKILPKVTDVTNIGQKKGLSEKQETKSRPALRTIQENAIHHVEPHTVAHDGSNTRPLRTSSSPLLTSVNKDKGKLVVLVDSREISNSQIVSHLRRKHNIKADVCQLVSCDYVVSNRMGVERKMMSDLANGSNSSKLVERMRSLCELYDRPCLIVEKDRVKPGETERTGMMKTKYFNQTLAMLAQTHIKLLFSDSQEDTAQLLADLAAIEVKKNAAIIVPASMNKHAEEVFRFLINIPKVSYVTALSLCSSFTTLGDLVNSSADELQRRTRNLAAPRALEIHKYLRENFDPSMA